MWRSLTEEHASSSQEADARVLARASTQPDSLPGHTRLSRLVSHDFKAPASAPSEQRSSGEGMDQSELDSNASFPPTPVSSIMYLVCLNMYVVCVLSDLELTPVIIL